MALDHYHHHSYKNRENNIGTNYFIKQKICCYFKEFPSLGLPKTNEPIPNSKLHFRSL